MKNSKRAFSRLFPPIATGKKRKSFLLEFLGAIVFLVLATIVAFSYYAIHHHREILFLEKINAGKITLSHFARGAAVPLLEMDFLSLNTSLKEIKYVDGFLYAFIVDNRNFIRAHTDHDQIGSLQKGFEHIQSRKEGDTISETIYNLSSGTQVLNLSTPLIYTQKSIGMVHLGLSLDTINRLVGEKVASLRKGLLSLGALMLMATIGTVLFLRTRLARRSPKQIGTKPKREDANLNQKSMSARIYKAIGVFKKQEQEIPIITRQQVTILFGGIKGFRDYAETRELEEVLKDLNEYFSITSQNILNQGGYIDKFVGDAVIGVFESLPFQKDHAERAVRAALAIQSTLQETHRNGNPLLSRVGIGLTSGIILSGHFESEGDEKHTFIGESFKEAYLLNVMAGPGEIILSKDVFHLIQDVIVVDPLPPLERKEKTAPWESFRLAHIRKSKTYV